jgi:hypothetical protein
MVIPSASMPALRSLANLGPASVVVEMMKLANVSQQRATPAGCYDR